MIDRDERALLIEVVDGIAAVAHHVGHEAVGRAHRDLRVVDEARLQLAPLPLVRAHRGVRERVEFECSCRSTRSRSVALGVATLVGRLHRAVVLGTELILEPATAVAAEPGSEDDDRARRPRRPR